MGTDGIMEGFWRGMVTLILVAVVVGIGLGALLMWLSR